MNIDLTYQNNTQLKKFNFILVAVALSVLFLINRNSPWHGSTNLHTIMEVIATLLALIIGISSLIRFKAKPDEVIFLFVGTGFLGTGFLDGYHAVVTSEFFNTLNPSPPESLIPWSWVASRLYLSIFLFSAYYHWRINKNKRIDPKKIYFITFITTLSSFLFFAFVPLPKAYYSGLFFNRPEELVPALFFGLALYGFYTKGAWKTSVFEYWLVLSLIVNFISQTIFMSFSHQLFDFDFDVAHLLKKVSYIAVLTGVYLSMLYSFKREVELSKDLEIQKEEFESIFKNAKDGIAIIDHNTLYINCNDAYAELTGYTKEELLSKLCNELTANEDQETNLQAVQHAIEHGYTQNFEKRCISKAGHEFTVSMSISLMPDKKRLLLTVKDITSLKLLEEQSRLASMGEMIGNIAHQWRQPLSVITTSASGLTAKTNFGIEISDKDIIKHSDLIVQQAEYLSQTIDNFRDFIKGDVEYKQVHIKKMLKQTLGLVEASLQDNYINCIVNLKDDLIINGNTNELSQAFINIINNAKDALRENIPDEKDRLLFISAEKTEHGDLEIRIKDNAGGIDTHIINRIFEPYFSTKHQSLGTGLGLSMADIIIRERHKGTIKVSNKKYKYNGKKYKGASFKILFKQ